MVFVIQNTQNRDTKALQLKLDELIRVNQVARNSLISLEEKSELEVEEIRRACLDGRVERREGAGALVRRSHLTSESHGVEQEIPRLRRYARALTRSGDRADDLVQDTLVRAMAKAHLWQAGTDIRAWLFTIMHNQHVNAVRRDSRTEDSRHRGAVIFARRHDRPHGLTAAAGARVRTRPPPRRAAGGGIARRPRRHVLRDGGKGPRRPDRNSALAPVARA